MATTLKQPHLSMTLRADRFAPRLARQALSSIGRPSPDLRDAVLLLTSSVITRACRAAAAHPELGGGADASGIADPRRGQLIELAAWMTRALVRVEVRAAPGLTAADERSGAPADGGAIDYERELLSALADRWGGDTGLIWFEIDRAAQRRIDTRPGRPGLRTVSSDAAVIG